MNAPYVGSWDAASAQISFALRLSAVWHESLQKLRRLDIEAADDAAKALHECAVKAAQERDPTKVMQLAASLMSQNSAAAVQYCQRAAAIGSEGVSAFAHDMEDTFSAWKELGNEMRAAMNLPAGDLVQGVPFYLYAQAAAPEAAAGTSERAAAKKVQPSRAKTARSA